MNEKEAEHGLFGLSFVYFNIFNILWQKDDLVKYIENTHWVL